MRLSLSDRLRAAPRRLLVGYALGLGAYLAAMALGAGNRPEQFLVTGLVLLLAAWSDGSRRLLSGILPFLVFGIVYDLTHLTQPLVRYLHVHVEEPYLFDRRFFGIASGDGVLTPNEWFSRHHWPAADFLAGLAYIVYVYWPIALAAALALFGRSAEERRLLGRFGWTFLAMNVVGFATYYLYPAAPPWYVADHGLGPADLSVRSSPAGAARWDALTGIPYFAGFYGRSADVFGAIPSLHVAYPLLTFLYGRELRKPWLDAANLGLFLLVSFAAVYLNHHYVLDVLLGDAYAVAAWGLERLLVGRRAGAPGAVAAAGQGESVGAPSASARAS